MNTFQALPGTDPTTPTNDTRTEPLPQPEPVVAKPSHIDTMSRKISTASSIGSNQSDGGSLAPDRSGSNESQNGDKKHSKPSRKISRFLVSPVVDKSDTKNPVVVGERTVIADVPDVKPKDKPLYSDVAKEHKETPAQLNGLPEELKAQAILPEPHPTQYTTQITQPVPTITDQRPVELPQKADANTTITSAPNNQFQQINQIQPSLTTPLQIATDTPVLGLSQVGTPMSIGDTTKLNVVQNVTMDPGAIQPSRLPLTIQHTTVPIPVTSDTMPNAENIQRMLLKQNIMRYFLNVS